jgi:glycosyltransferase involved in cell wall biosynthesis
MDLSVIIPSRSDQYLQKTVDDILSHAETKIEVIVVLDGIWSSLKDDPRVTIIHHGEVHDNVGMRGSINAGVKISKGKYLLIIDEQCGVDQGFDRKLMEHCKDDWVVIPRRYRLEPETWTLIEDGRPPIDYMCIDYPYQRPFDKTCGLHGAEWKRPDRERYMIDDTPTMQGSCYFMTRKHWDNILPNGLDDVNYGTFTQEAQEVSMATWLSGGRVVVNKNTWYSHFHKGKRGKGYGFSNEQYKKHLAGTERGRLFCISYWLNTRDYLYDFKWFVNTKFPNMPGWENWEERIKEDAPKDFSATYDGEYKPSW